MARTILAIESFETFASTDDLSAKYNSDTQGGVNNLTIGASYGRNGTGLRADGASTGNFYVSVAPGLFPLVVSFALRVVEPPTGGGTHALLTFHSIYGGEYSIALGSTGFRLFRANSYGAQSGLEYTDWVGPYVINNVWHQVEIKYYCSEADGFCNVYLDNQLVAFPTQGTTSPGSGDTEVNSVRFGWSPIGGSSGCTFDISDIVIAASDDLRFLTDSGADSNATDRIESAYAVFNLKPTSDDTVDWTPSSSPVSGNYPEVDDDSPDADTTYNSSLTPGDEDAFGIEAFPSVYAGSEVLAAQVNVMARQTASGVRSLAAKINARESATALCPATYHYYSLAIGDDGASPAGELTETLIEAATIGYELKT